AERVENALNVEAARSKTAEPCRDDDALVSVDPLLEREPLRGRRLAAELDNHLAGGCVASCHALDLPHGTLETLLRRAVQCSEARAHRNRGGQRSSKGGW